MLSSMEITNNNSTNLLPKIPPGFQPVLNPQLKQLNTIELSAVILNPPRLRVSGRVSPIAVHIGQFNDIQPPGLAFLPGILVRTVDLKLSANIYIIIIEKVELKLKNVYYSLMLTQGISVYFNWAPI